MRKVLVMSHGETGRRQRVRLRFKKHIFRDRDQVTYRMLGYDGLVESTNTFRPT